MADLSDVLAAIQAVAVGALYPNGSPPSILGVPIKIYPGWPDSLTVEADVRPTGTNTPPNGPPSALHVSIFPRPMERNTTRYPRDRREGTPNPATYTLAAAGQVITVGGAAPASFYVQNIAVFLGGAPVLYSPTAGQTPAQVAASLLSLIQVAYPSATLSGAAITLPAGVRIGALRVGTTAPVTRELRRQERQFQITAWADNPARRRALAEPVDLALCALTFLPLADGTLGKINYHGTSEVDTDQTRGIYRRDLLYTVEYPTIGAETAAQLIAGVTELRDPFGNLITTTYS